MRISNKYVQLEADLTIHPSTQRPVTLSFPQTKAKLVLTDMEARQLYHHLEQYYGPYDAEFNKDAS